VASGVSKTLTYLVTNDTSSGSSKNKKAADLGIEIITEKEFLSMIQ
jgi:DNA ligase (NAD+)